MNEDTFGTLTAYTRGHISRGQAMRSVGLDWYGDLIILLRSAGLEVQQPSPEELAAMDTSVASVFSGATSRSQESNR